MPGPINKVSVILNGGVDEQGASELSAPVAAQGSSVTLRRSENTRLSPLRGTCVRAPACESEGSYSSAIHGVIPSEKGENALVLQQSHVHRILGPNASGDTTQGEGRMLSQTTGANAMPAVAFLPGRIDASGGCPGEPGTSDIATAYDSTTGYLYHAYSVYRQSDSLQDIVVYVTGSDGSIIATPRRALLARALGAIALTGHGASGMKLWLCTGGGSEGPGGDIDLVTLEYIGNNTITTSEATLALDGSGLQFSVCSGELVNADGTTDATSAQYAFVTTLGLTSGNVVSRVDVVTAAIVSVNVAIPAQIYAAVCFSATSVGPRLAAAFQTGATIETQIFTPAMVLQNSGTAGTGGAKIACQFTLNPADSTSYLIILQEGALTEDGSDGILVLYQGAASNMVVSEQPLPWMRLYSAGGQHRLNSSAAYAVFPLVRYYGSDDDTLISADYVSDPDVQVWMFRSYNLRAPVVRYGTVRGSSAPARTRAPGDAWAHVRLAFFGEGTFATYAKAETGSTAFTPCSSRWVSFSFPVAQPALAYDRDGVTLAAAAVAFEWDGVMPVEMGGPLYSPHLTVEGESFVGPAWTAGDYLVAAIYEWTDAAGRTHRSRIDAKEFTSTGGGPEVFVTAPTASHRDGLYDVDVECVLYASTATDTTLRRLPAIGTRTQGGWTFTLLSPASESAAVLYSTGEAAQEQMPQPPPPLWDVEIVADRAWGIDAEMRSRLVYSKRRVAGVGFEWHPGQEILLPSGSGPAMAVREWQGNVVVFAQYGIFGISGDGPDNLVGNPSGGGFSKPQKIADIGTTNHHSVVSTPSGIVFQRDEDMMLFAGGAPKNMVGPRCDAACLTALVLRDQDEAVFFFPGQQKVWNYAFDRWTTWELVDEGTEEAGNFHVAVALPYDRRVAVLASADTFSPHVHRLDSAATGSLPMVWETDWVLLGGDFNDHVNVQHVVFNARRGGAHGVTIEVFTGHNESAATPSRAYSTAEITSLAGTIGRYTIKIQPTNRGTRAVKIRITETDPVGDGMVPLSLTLYYNVESALMETDIRPAALK